MDKTYPEKSNKFLKIFFSLNEQEKQEFKEFCRLKFIGKGRNYHKITEDILNGNNNIKSRTSWNRLSELNRIIEDYLLLKDLQTNKEERNAQLLEIYNKRPINDLIESQFNFASKIFEEQKFNERTFFNFHRIHMALSIHHIHNNKFLKFIKHFRKQSEYVIGFFLTDLFSMQTEFSQQKLEHFWHDWLANEEVLNAMDSDKIMESFKNNIPEINKYIQYYYYLYKAFDDPDKPENFFKAHEKFTELLPTLNHKYASMAYQTLINYCINKTNNYDIPFYKVLFDIYNEKLSSGFDEDIRNKNYPTNNFRDYVIVGLRLKEYEWVDNFITKYGKLLPDDYKPDEVNITRAMLHLSKNQPDTSMKFLEKTKRRNYLHYVDTAEMKMRIYYDKNDLINAEEEMIRLHKYLAANETIPRQRKSSYENFVRMFKKVLQLRDKFSEEKLAKIESAMQRIPNFFRRAWIEEKLKEFKK